MERADQETDVTSHVRIKKGERNERKLSSSRGSTHQLGAENVWSLCQRAEAAGIEAREPGLKKTKCVSMFALVCPSVSVCVWVKAAGQQRINVFFV